MSCYKRKHDEVYSNYNENVVTQVQDEYYDRIQCKHCLIQVTHHATQLKAHLKEYIYTFIIIRCKKAKTVQTTLPLSKYRSKDITTKLVNLIVENNCSYRLLRSKSFQELVEFINPKVKIPTIAKMKETLKEEGDKCVEQSIDKESKFCLILDGWKNIMNQSVINLAIKQHDNEIVFIESVYMYDNEKSVNLIKLINETLEKHKLKLTNVCAICTDNNCTMKKLGKDIMTKIHYPVITFGCLCHIINLIVKKILEIKYYKETLLYCNELVHKLNTTKKAAKDIYEKTGKSINIRKGCITSWSSVSQLFNGIMNNKEILIDIGILQNDRIERITEIQKITDYLAQKTQQLSKDEALLTDGFNIISNLKEDILKMAKTKQEKDYNNKRKEISEF